MKNVIKGLFAFFVCLLLLNSTALAADGIMPTSSAYIFGTHANMKAGNNGELNISFWISSPAIMSELGASSIDIYENNGHSTRWIDSIYVSDRGNEKMLGSGTYHSCDLIYQGTIGYEYYAKIHFTASDNTGGDTITKTTPTATAKS